MWLLVLLEQYQPEKWFKTNIRYSFSVFFVPFIWKFLLQLCEKQEMIHTASDSYRNELTGRGAKRKTHCLSVVPITWQSCSTARVVVCFSLSVCVCERTNHWHSQTCGIHTSSLLSPVAQWHTDHVWPRDNRPKPPSGHSCDPIAFPRNLCVTVCV